MKKRYIIAALLMALGCAPSARAESTDVLPQVLIAAIQTSRVGGAGDDYVLLHNNSDSPVDVTGWKLQYRAASGTGTTGWTTKSTFACSETANDCRVAIDAQGNLVVSTYEIPDMTAQKLSSGFSDSGGQVRIAQPVTSGSDVVTIDMVGYGTAVNYEGASPAPAPAAGQIIGRKADDADLLIDTNNNGADFTVGCLTPTVAGSAEVSPCPVEQTANEDGQTPPPDQTTDTDNGTPAVYAPLIITELLPDPASPALDSNDEFIELYNPTGVPVNIAGYTLESGADFKYHYVLGDVTIPAGSYYAVYSAESHISLTNTGTAVRVLSPAGDVLDTVATYGQAKTGQAWAKSGDMWQWSTSPTPSAQNSVTVEPAKALLTAATSATKKPTAATTKKSSATGKTTASAAKTAAAKPSKTESAASPAPQQDTTTTLNYIILGAAGLGVLGYVGYEYRHEFARLWTKTKSAFSRRKSTEPEPTLQMD